MAQVARKTERYPSDLTDKEWEVIAPLMPKPGEGAGLVESSSAR